MEAVHTSEGDEHGLRLWGAALCSECGMRLLPGARVTWGEGSQEPTCRACALGEVPALPVPATA